MSKYRNETHERLSKLSDDEFYELLEEAGFELEEGEGHIIFTDEEKLEEATWQLEIKSSFNLKKTTFTTSRENEKFKNQDFKYAC